MLKIAIDASIVLKWFSHKDERLVSEAREIYRKILTGEMEAIAPNFLLIEITNVFLNKKKIGGEKLETILQFLLTMGINFVEFQFDQIGEVSLLAEKYSLTSYDALYLFVAMSHNLKLVTEDDLLLKISDHCVDIVNIG